MPAAKRARRGIRILPLPLEILAHIFSFLPFSALPTILRVNKAVFPLAARLIYRTLSLTEGRPLLPLIDPALLSPYHRRILKCSTEWDDSPYSKSTSLRTYTTRFETEVEFIPIDEDIFPVNCFAANPLPRLRVLCTDHCTFESDMHVECTGDHLGFYERLRPTTLIIKNFWLKQLLPRPREVCSAHDNDSTPAMSTHVAIPRSVTRLVLVTPNMLRMHAEEIWDNPQPSWNWHTLPGMFHDDHRPPIHIHFIAPPYKPVRFSGSLTDASGRQVERRISNIARQLVHLLQTSGSTSMTISGFGGEDVAFSQKRLVMALADAARKALDEAKAKSFLERIRYCSLEELVYECGLEGMMEDVLQVKELRYDSSDVVLSDSSDE